LRWKNDYNENLVTLSLQLTTLERKLDDAEDDARKLSDRRSGNYTLQGKLQAEVEVSSATMALLH